jgi:hypothetical protein
MRPYANGARAFMRNEPINAEERPRHPHLRETLTDQGAIMATVLGRLTLTGVVAGPGGVLDAGPVRTSP